MREYEALIFVKETAGAKDPIKDASDLLTGIVKQQGGEVLKLEAKGRRAIGYKIDKQKEGQLVMMYCRFAPSAIIDLKRAFHLNPDVLTSMITVKEKPPALLQPREARPVKKPVRGRPRFGEREAHASKP